MIKITYNNKLYTISKDKIKFILEKLASREISEPEIIELLKEYNLMDEDFLENISKI